MGTVIISHSNYITDKIRLTKADYGPQNRNKKGSEYVPFTQRNLWDKTICSCPVSINIGVLK